MQNPVFDVNVTPDQSALLCPECGGEYLHHYLTTKYGRAREDAPTRYAFWGEFLDPEESPLENPSDRRDAVGVRFYCETCLALSELTISQHKGWTFLALRSCGTRSPSTPSEV